MFGSRRDERGASAPCAAGLVCRNSLSFGICPAGWDESDRFGGAAGLPRRSHRLRRVPPPPGTEGAERSLRGARRGGSRKVLHVTPLLRAEGPARPPAHAKWSRYEPLALESAIKKRPGWGAWEIGKRALPYSVAFSTASPASSMASPASSAASSASLPPHAVSRQAPAAKRAARRRWMSFPDFMTVVVVVGCGMINGLNGRKAPGGMQMKYSSSEWSGRVEME